jgi:ribosomal protein L37AE/L43A
MYELDYWLNNKDIRVGDKFGISWKVGKRRKIRSYRLLRHESHHCDQCYDSYTVLEIASGGRSQICDNHFRTGTFYLNP